MSGHGGKGAPSRGRIRAKSRAVAKDAEFAALALPLIEPLKVNVWAASTLTVELALPRFSGPLTPKLPLTQEFLAQMLGTRRSSVTVAAGALQKAGTIAYVRGSITILNRQKLEGAACDCYEILQHQLATWEGEAP